MVYTQPTELTCYHFTKQEAQQSKFVGLFKVTFKNVSSFWQPLWTGDAFNNIGQQFTLHCQWKPWERSVFRESWFCSLWSLDVWSPWANEESCWFSCVHRDFNQYGPEATFCYSTETITVFHLCWMANHYDRYNQCTNHRTYSLVKKFSRIWPVWPSSIGVLKCNIKAGLLFEVKA